MLSEEEFARWRDDPVTQFIFNAIRKGEADQKEQWLAASWDGGQSDPALLAELRTRADAYNALIETSYQGWLEIMEQSC